MDLQEAFNRWRVTSGRQRSTAEAYETRLRALEAFGIKTVEQATDPRLLTAYLTARLRGGASAGTANGELAALSSIVGHAVRTGAVVADVEAVRSLKIPVPPRDALTSAETIERDVFVRVARELLVIDEPAELAIQIVARAALRCGEVLRLARENVDLERRHIELPWRTKNRKPRRVPLVFDLHELLERRLPQRPGLIFPARREGTRLPHLHPETFRGLIRQAVRAAGLKDHIVPKLLRASCASWWALEGGESMNVIKIAQAMGNSPKVAERYYINLRGGYDPAFERPEHRKLGLAQASKVAPVQAPRVSDTTILLPTPTPGTPLSLDDTLRLEAAQRVLARLLETGTRKLTDDEAARLNARCVGMTLDGRRA